jgi:hypothetical protein
MAAIMEPGGADVIQPVVEMSQREAPHRDLERHGSGDRPIHELWHRTSLSHEASPESLE